MGTLLPLMPQENRESFWTQTFHHVVVSYKTLNFIPFFSKWMLEEEVTALESWLLDHEF